MQTRNQRRQNVIKHRTDLIKKYRKQIAGAAKLKSLKTDEDRAAYIQFRERKIEKHERDIFNTKQKLGYVA